MAFRGPVVLDRIHVFFLLISLLGPDLKFEGPRKGLTWFFKNLVDLIPGRKNKFPFQDPARHRGRREDNPAHRAVLEGEGAVLQGGGFLRPPFQGAA